MTDQPAKSSDEESSKTLVRVLIILGIGIPVLVELLTLFNLINVQLFEDEEVIKQEDQPVKVQEYVIGDTLFADTAVPIAIADMLIKVSAREWEFKFMLNRSDTLSEMDSEIKVDSIKLKSGKILEGEEWEIHDEKPSMLVMEWDLPNGDMPTVLYMSAQQSMPKDSVSNLQQQVQLGKIPVRYSQDNDDR